MEIPKPPNDNGYGSKGVTDYVLTIGATLSSPQVTQFVSRYPGGSQAVDTALSRRSSLISRNTSTAASSSTHHALECTIPKNAGGAVENANSQQAAGFVIGLKTYQPSSIST